MSFYQQTLLKFVRITRMYRVFHLVFFVVFAAELLTLLLFLPFLAKSYLLAVVVASTFLTAFSYFVLRFYFQTKKPEQLLELRSEFIENCENFFQETVVQLIQKLEGLEFHYYSLPSIFGSVSPLVKKFSAWSHFEDVLLFKELLYSHLLKIELEAVKNNPTNTELHRNLAKSYIAFYHLYRDSGTAPYPFITKRYTSAEIVQKFQKNAKCALEELKIVLHFVPLDPWALTQLGKVYRDLDQKDEERKIYEILLQLIPDEQEIRYRLGVVYFQLGFMASGLTIYEEFRQMNDPKAQELIGHYDAFHTQSM